MALTSEEKKNLNEALIAAGLAAVAGGSVGGENARTNLLFAVSASAAVLASLYKAGEASQSNNPVSGNLNTLFHSGESSLDKAAKNIAYGVDFLKTYFK